MALQDEAHNVNRECSVNHVDRIVTDLCCNSDRHGSTKNSRPHVSKRQLIDVSGVIEITGSDKSQVWVDEQED